MKLTRITRLNKGVYQCFLFLNGSDDLSFRFCANAFYGPRIYVCSYCSFYVTRRSHMRQFAG